VLACEAREGVRWKRRARSGRTVRLLSKAVLLNTFGQRSLVGDNGSDWYIRICARHACDLQVWSHLERCLRRGSARSHCTLPSDCGIANSRGLIHQQCNSGESLDTSEQYFSLELHRWGIYTSDPAPSYEAPTNYAVG
jgi:hypothetical protein